MVRYGYFDDERREYVIERPDTPTPWLNYLGSDDFYALVSQTGSGYAFYRDARLRRLTRYRYNAAPLDGGGRYLYLRDAESGQVWRPTGDPARPAAAERYRARVGLGYTIIETSVGGIATETTFLVPPGETAEVWRVVVRNERHEAAALSLFAAVEWCLWDAQDDATNFQRNYSTGEVAIEPGVVYHTTEYRERRDHFAYFASSVPTAGFDTARGAFLGPYRGWDAPLAVEQGACTGSLAHGWQPIAAHQVRLALAPGQPAELSFALGYAENEHEAKWEPGRPGMPATAGVHAALGRLFAPGAAETARAALATAWQERLGGLAVTTPEAHLDRMLNAWNPYQVMTTFSLSRSASLYESGIGRGIGFRDGAQDLLGFVHLVPERARERLLDLASTQLESGGAYHQYQPLTKRGNDAVGSGFNDDPAWLVIAAGAYVRETGDAGVLDAPVAYDSTPGTETPLFEHLERALGYIEARRGPHDLPRIGRADWNDCLNLNCFSVTPGESFQTTQNREGGAAESTVIAALFVLAAGELAALAALRGDGPTEARWSAAGAAMRAALERDGWDGGWYRRAYDYDGRPVGSAGNAEGSLFIEPQGLCVMAGAGRAEGRARAALEAVRDRLASGHGIALLSPAFSRYYPEYGEISSYPPGYKENAGIFCHTNPWLMIAEAMLGNGDGALDYYLRINPSVREAISEVHRAEPYVYAQMIAGPDAPTFGEAKNSWLTGTAAWNLVAASQWILGLRPEHGGLRIDPVLPAAWEGFQAVRRFRGATYRIAVSKPAGLVGRVRRLRVDGVEVEGSLAPLPGRPGQELAIEAVVEAEPDTAGARGREALAAEEAAG